MRRLAPREVHVWTFRLDRSAVELRQLGQLLASDERERAARFHFEQDCNRWTAARGLVRQILGHYCDRPPETLAFEYGAHGKPALRGHAVQFNIAHSAHLGVCAVALADPLGVDLERIRTDFDLGELARQSFSVAEQAVLATYPKDQQANAFFRCWSSKEAYVKARGAGLSIPLDSFDVPLGTPSSDSLVRTRETTADAGGWFIRELRTDPAFAAALAVRASVDEVHTWDWDDSPPAYRARNALHSATQTG